MNMKTHSGAHARHHTHTHTHARHDTRWTLQSVPQRSTDLLPTMHTHTHSHTHTHTHIHTHTHTLCFLGGIANIDRIQLELALFDKQTCTNKTRGAYKEMTQEHKTRQTLV